MYVVNRLGEISQLTATHDTKLCPGNNSIRFKLNCRGYNYAYVVGDFNNWQKTVSSRLIWSIDPNDGDLKMGREILFSQQLQSGLQHYCFILVDNLGHEFRLLPGQNPDEKFSFIWQESRPELRIMSSENTLHPGHPLELIAILDQPDGSRKVLTQVIWQLEPSHPGIMIQDQTVISLPGLSELKEISISCQHPSSGLAAIKNFTLNYQNRQGSLLHFIKCSGDYSGEQHLWDLWTYDDDGSSVALPLSSQSDFGPTALVKATNVIARRKSWGYSWSNDWSDQTASFRLDDGQSNYYLIYGETKLYSDLATVIRKTNPQISSAVMDSAHRIMAYLSHPPLIGTQFQLFINSKLQANVDTLIKDEINQVIFSNLPHFIKPSDLVEIRANISYPPHKVKMRDYLDSFYYPGSAMGMVFTTQEISLRIWAPTAFKVALLIYATANQDINQPDQIYPLVSESLHGTHCVNLLRRENENKYYLFRLSFHDLDEQHLHCVSISHALDPYAPAVSLNGQRGVLLDINSPQLKPHDWEEVARPYLEHKEDAIIYEMHLRDFTIAEESGIAPELRGTFLAAVTPNTHYRDSDGAKITTGIDSLTELGITHVHLLPFFDFSSVDEARRLDPENRNWGYDPQNYNAPEGSYSLNPEQPGQRILEARSMICGFHRRGIRVIMDVVYNHMSDTNNLDKIVPGYYFRSDEFGKYTNGSGCGNELASERPMVSRFIQDSILHWINNYKIDGLRLDLMELMDFSTMQKIVQRAQEVDPTILIYGEPWKGGDSPLKNPTYRGSQKEADFSIFNDIFRDAIRGNNGPATGFVNGEQHNSQVNAALQEGLRGSINGLTAKPQESVNYVDAHDNYTLWDHLEKSQNPALQAGEYQKNLPTMLFDSPLVRQYLLALGIILTAQGIPFIQGGAEFLRSKQGDHNSYRSSDQINALNWANKAKFKPIFAYLQGLIELRRQHPAFRMLGRQQVFEHMTVQHAHNDPGSGVIISQLKDHANGDSWKNIVIIYNATAIDGYDINSLLPASEHGIWNIVVNHEKAGTTVIAQVAEYALPTLRSHSMLVIYC